MTTFVWTSCEGDKIITIFRYAAAALAVLPTPVFAQAADDDIVVTASGFEQPRSETGQAIEIVGRARLEQLQSATIAQVLQTVPGVSVATRGGLGGQTSAFIRGGSSAQTLVLIDGVRINDLTSPNGAFDFGALMTGNIGRVEILRGPNSVIWGSQAIGGVVNIQSIAPVDGFEGRLGAEFGGYDTKRLNANIAGTKGVFEGSVGGAFVKSAGISALAGGTERDGYANATGNARLKVNISDSFTLDFRSYYNRAKVEYDSEFGVGANGLPVSRNRQFVGYVGAQFDMLDGRFHNRIAYTRTDLRRIGTDPIVFSFNNFNVRGAIDRMEYHTAFDLNEALTLVAGLEYERTFASTSFEGAAPDIARNDVVSGFGQIIVRPVNGLTLTAGVRHDAYSDYGGQTTLGGNLAFTPNEGRTMFRATYAEGFRAPTLTEGQPPYGNLQLKPETARNFDLGVEQQFLEGKAQLFATYFNRRSNNLIAFSPVSFQSENIDKVTAKGLEIGLDLNPSSQLDIRASYTLVDAINRTAGDTFGNRQALRPQNSFSLTADWQTAFGLSLGSSLLIIDDSFDDAANNVRLDGYALVGLRASMPLNAALDVYARVENMLDAQYTVVSGYNSFGRHATIGVRAKF
ncbi:MAG: TonB-dependent receptor [Sphingorhabdus sp.]|uniref:TonB-dependent receptor plug domain-containing protein n=1 Tax=Sphingorhabdus sp. TaxID=1902408 RepID=UPI00273EF29F|nr:TonB-dependent receptor [Sphingorhabdus sp.]MDP4758053.1 TonB-dependent receptor [Sphingorhabdus sp.]MDP4872118.1 TonB-dependent receptor [Sphingorhabdus sp.]MDP4926924.1 TonB-dependent receptor [Sphingorhabdus sp.]